jgi:hypothetical protein
LSAFVEPWQITSVNICQSDALLMSKGVWKYAFVSFATETQALHAKTVLNDDPNSTWHVCPPRPPVPACRILSPTSVQKITSCSGLQNTTGQRVAIVHVGWPMLFVADVFFWHRTRLM